MEISGTNKTAYGFKISEEQVFCDWEAVDRKGTSLHGQNSPVYVAIEMPDMEVQDAIKSGRISNATVVVRGKRNGKNLW